MNHFFKYTGFIVCITLAFMIILDQAYSYVFTTSVARSKIQMLLQLKDVHYDIAFFGSSRTENHIDCDLIVELTGKSCMNFGISGGTLGDMNVLIRLMKSRNVSFDKAFLQIDYNYNRTGLSPNFKARLVPFVQNKIVKEALVDESDYLSYAYVPFYRYLKNDKVVGFRELNTSILNNEPKTDLNIGFVAKKGIGNQVSGSFPSKLIEKNANLESIKNILREQEVSLICFTAPYCKNATNRESTMKILKRRLPELLDYTAIYDDDPAYFFNCGHLNIEGARAFSKRIVTDVLQQN